MFIILMLTGMLLILMGLQRSIYSKNFSEKNKKINRLNSLRYIKMMERITEKFPLNLIYRKLDRALAFFMLEETLARSMTAILTVLIPMTGIVLYCFLSLMLSLWYTKLVTLVLCITIPYYMATLLMDYMKYSLRLKIPLLVDSFRSSFIVHSRIKPALQECSNSIDRRMGNMMRRVADSSDLNESLGRAIHKIDDTWFCVFVTLLMNYRENGGELIKQLYKLNRTITRYNNIEKKKNKRLIWYEFFVLAASIFSLPAIVIINRAILGSSVGMHYDSTSAFARIVLYSLFALITVRVLRRL